jgi:hypothetical protein
MPYDASSREAFIGRLGEILIVAVLRALGFAILDISASANRRSPLIRADMTYAAPDILAARRVPLQIEAKTKWTAFEWRGGSPDDTRSERLPAGAAYDIDAGAYSKLLRTQHHMRMPVVLAMLCITRAELRANTLAGLGPPYPSVNSRHPRENWPRTKFRLIREFDRRRLSEVFQWPDGRGADLLKTGSMPSVERLQRLYDYLKPQQGNFELFREDIFAQWERLNPDAEG